MTERYKEIEEKLKKDDLKRTQFIEKYINGGLIEKINYEELEKLDNTHFTRKELSILMALSAAICNNNLGEDVTLRPAECEGMVCLYKTKDNTWISYEATERNGVAYLAEYGDLYEACLELIGRSFYLIHYMDYYDNYKNAKEEFLKIVDLDVTDEEIDEFIKRHNIYYRGSKRWVCDDEPKLVRK